MSKNTLILIDGNAIMHRAYHALPPLSTTDGAPTQVIFGFLSMVYKVASDFSPTHLAVAFDTPKPTFRHQLFKEYQSQRPKIEDNFKKQIPLVKEAVDLSGIYRLEKEGYEADDIIGTICKNLEKHNDFNIFIISGDKDILQLINNHVYVTSPVSGLTTIKIYDEKKVLEKFGVLPKQIVDYKALIGDQSDNYKGAKGIGPVTASKLINQFGTIDNLYQNINQIESEKIKKILIQEKEKVYLFKKLATILTDLPIEIDINKMRFFGFNKKLKDFLEKYQINSLVKRIFGEEEKKEKKQEEKPKIEQKTLF
jgi:DNA polymerase-1